ncbi:trans-sulfuration enzyme family protein [Anaerosporobacter faecicola]|uniref:trans-sulfuration enzyme family protein n=1 Tax=Anaerosporobacter faecicola TaxID=2718714 RepID=UPI001439CB28|nr:PLP-dependent aspartate aminotransferase family protein [Anaerosporobacter faecicola]
MKNFSNYDCYDRKEGLAFESKCVHGALGCEPLTGSVSFPIFQSATFRHKGLGESTGFDYARLQNPTRQELERTMAILECGTEGFAFSSGQAANMAVFSLLKPGDQVILSDDIYGGTYRLGADTFHTYGITFTYVDMTDTQNIKDAITEHTKMLFVETPTNPMMKVINIREVVAIAKEINAITVVDNTFLTPYFQKPLTLGADIVVHSGTKFLSGHNDTLAGLVVTNRDDLAEQLRLEIKTHGSCLGPQDCWLLIRGIKTLALRMKQHNANGIKVAEWLRTQKKVKNVNYIGFPDHPGYEVNRSQATGSGSMISFNVDSFETVKKILSGVDLVIFAESLGGTETLITYPRTQTHESIPEEIRQKIGITDTLLRLSVGIEDADDIIRDLDRALNA